ncbi:MAG: hypothetical protein ACON38_18210, partial [Akkermansiaceae bacterium]
PTPAALLRGAAEAGTEGVWVLDPYRKGGQAPEITLTESGARISLGEQIDEVVFEEDGGVLVKRGESDTVLADQVE